MASGPRCPRAAAGALECSTADRYYQPAIRQRRPRDMEHAPPRAPVFGLAVHSAPPLLRRRGRPADLVGRPPVGRFVRRGRGDRIAAPPCRRGRPKSQRSPLTIRVGCSSPSGQRPPAPYDLEALRQSGDRPRAALCVVGAGASRPARLARQADKYAIGFPATCAMAMAGSISATPMTAGRDRPLVVRRLPMVDGRRLAQFPSGRARPASVADRDPACSRPAGRRHLAGPAPQRTPARKLFHQLHRPIRR